MKAVRIHNYGDSSQLIFEDAANTTTPQADEILVQQTFCGVNFIDIYHRTGLYKLPSLPATLGMEAVGVVKAVGENVNFLKVGDRVAYTSMGTYTESYIVPAERVVKIPDRIKDEEAAASLLKGLTAAYLLNHTTQIKAGQTILVHAAAGGVGLLLCSWAKSLGARVIGTTSSDNKAAIAKSYGADEMILYNKENVVTRVQEFTDNQGVDVVYDSVGQSTFEASLACLKRRGLMVSFGQSSGKTPNFDITTMLAPKSLFLTRPSLMHYTVGSELQELAALLFDFLEKSHFKIMIDQIFHLHDAARAHDRLASRQSIGSLVLKV